MGFFGGLLLVLALAGFAACLICLFDPTKTEKTFKREMTTKEIMRGPFLGSVVIGIIGLAMVGASAGASSTTQAHPESSAATGQPESSAPAASDAASSVSDSSSAPDATPSGPDHYYSVEDSGEYGYEAAVSQDQQNAGQATGDMTMVRYLGKHGDTQKLLLKTDGSWALLDCKEPCEFGKLHPYYQGQVGDGQLTRIADGTIGWEAAQDAMNGKLEIYKSGQ